MARREWTYEFTAHTTAPLETVWPLIAEVERWKDWSFLTRSFLLVEGGPVPNGVGARRRMAVGPFGSEEEVVLFEPPHHLGYVARKGMPVKQYRADVVLSPDGDGTTITWTGALVPKVPGTGVFVWVYARTFVRRFVRQLAAYTKRSLG